MINLPDSPRSPSLMERLDNLVHIDNLVHNAGRFYSDGALSRVDLELFRELVHIVKAMLESEQHPRLCSKCGRGIGSIEKPLCAECQGK